MAGWFSYTALVDGNVLSASDINTPLSSAANGTVDATHGGTGLTSGTAFGFPYFATTTTMASSAAGTTGQFLIATTSAAPSWSSTLAMEDSRTNTVVYPFTATATTSGTPAAGIGVGIKYRAESADEVPSDFGTTEFAASDVTAGSEDTYFQVLLRVAGAALTSCYRFAATGAFNAIFTHANSAARTYTLPDASGTIALTSTTALAFAGGSTTEGTTTSTSIVDLVVVSGLSIPATQPFVIMFSHRKTSGFVAASSLGLTINATSVTGGYTATSVNNANEYGNGYIYVPGYIANYARASGWMTSTSGGTPLAFAADSADRPNATTTSITITGFSGNGAVTTGVKNVFVYTLATS